MRFKIDWASLILGRKFTVFLCFTLYLRAIFKYKPPWGAYIWRGDLTEGFLRYEFGGLIHGGAYFRNFTVFGFELRNLVFRFNEPRISFEFFKRNPSIKIERLSPRLDLKY